MASITYRAKVLTNCLGEHYVKLKKNYNRSDFAGEHDLKNTDMFPAVLKREVAKVLGRRDIIKLNECPDNVIISNNEFLAIVTIGL